MPEAAVDCAVHVRGSGRVEIEGIIVVHDSHYRGARCVNAFYFAHESEGRIVYSLCVIDLGDVVATRSVVKDEVLAIRREVRLFRIPAVALYRNGLVVRKCTAIPSLSD